MCSGCSGNFDDGDWEPNDSSMAECDPEVFWLSLREHRQGWSAKADGDARGALDVDYEVLVTADRIVERRTIRAKSFAVSEKASEVGVPECGQGLNAFERSWLAKPKDYQTFTVFQHMGDRGGCEPRKSHLWRRLAGVAIAAVALWLAAW